MEIIWEIFTIITLILLTVGGLTKQNIIYVGFLLIYATMRFGIEKICNTIKKERE